MFQNKHNKTDIAVKWHRSRELKLVLTDYCYWVTQEILLHWVLHTKKMPATDLLKSICDVLKLFKMHIGDITKNI